MPWLVSLLPSPPPSRGVHLGLLQAFFDDERDHEYPFNSSKKRSSVLITRPDGTLRLYSKGASETSEFPLNHWTGGDAVSCPEIVRVEGRLDLFLYFVCILYPHSNCLSM